MMSGWNTTAGEAGISLSMVELLSSASLSVSVSIDAADGIYTNGSTVGVGVGVGVTLAGALRSRELFVS